MAVAFSSPSRGHLRRQRKTLEKLRENTGQSLAARKNDPHPNRSSIYSDGGEASRMSSSPNPQSDADQLELAADQAIAACGGDAREAVKALIVSNYFLETELEKLKAAASMGYARGALPRDRKDWYD
jgi:hypothetical protein